MTTAARLLESMDDAGPELSRLPREEELLPWGAFFDPTATGVTCEELGDLEDQPEDEPRYPTSCPRRTQAMLDEIQRELSGRVGMNNRNEMWHSWQPSLDGGMNALVSAARADAHVLALWIVRRIAKEHGFG